MNLDRLNEVLTLPTLVQVQHNGSLVRVESVNESEQGSTADIVYVDSDRRTTVPVSELGETSLSDAENEYIFDASTRWSPIIRS